MMAAPSVLLLFLTLTDAAAGLFEKKTHIYSNLSLSWTDAQTYCKKNYVDLSIIDTQSEFENLRSQMDIGWIGLRKNPNETFTRWTDGTVLQFSKWKSGYPNYTDNNHCVLTINNEWENENCTTMKNFFCYTWEPRMIVVQEMKNWEEALVHCRTFYTDLVSLTSETDHFAVSTRSKDILTPAFWTGLRFMDGSWFWVNKDSVKNLTSLPSCPARPFLCGVRNIKAGVWENRDCEEKMNFICYHKANTTAIGSMTMKTATTQSGNQDLYSKSTQY